MNERIKELLAQSTKEIWGNDPYNGSPVFEGYEVDQEKFAELLIKECTQTLEDNLPMFDCTEWEEDWNKGYYRGMEDCMHHIKEHFGIK